MLNSRLLRTWVVWSKLISRSMYRLCRVLGRIGLILVYVTAIENNPY
jgi:hypothetical protein